MSTHRNRYYAISLPALAALLLLMACGGAEEDEATAMGMTPEEHALMQAGGGQGQADSTGALLRVPVQLTAGQESALGVVYVEVTPRRLERTIRTVGRVVAAEDRVADVTLKIAGFVEDLFVGTTGEAVRQEQRLLTLYSPELVAAQEELLTAKRLAGRVDPSAAEAWRSAQSMLEASRRRLSYWDITDGRIDQLEATGEVSKTLPIVSPVSGIVLEKLVLEGQRVDPGQLLYRIADLSEVWVEGDVFEQDLQLIETGADAHIEVSAYPGEHLMGRVSFVYPVVDIASRTNRVRVSLANPDLRLKPGMYATMFFESLIAEKALAVPTEAVLVTGERNIVFTREEGSLRPREVVLGHQAGDLVQILSGLEPGEVIVASANFLIDAESRLATTGGVMPGTQHSGHGSVLEPGGEGAPGDDAESEAKPAGREHQHD